MARYKPYNLNQSKMIPLSYADQIVQGSFEYALNEIVEEQLDRSVFEHRYRNDATGRSAYDPKVLLKVVLYGYYRGIISSRRIAEACRRNVVFMALSADSTALESLWCWPRRLYSPNVRSLDECASFDLESMIPWRHQPRPS